VKKVNFQKKHFTFEKPCPLLFMCFSVTFIKQIYFSCAFFWFSTTTLLLSLVLQRSQLTLHAACSTPINSLMSTQCIFSYLVLCRPNNPGRMTLPHPLALATSDANANASADTNQTQMATMAEQHYLHPKGATLMPTQVTQMPLMVTYSKKWSITASGHTNVSALLDNNIISDTVSVTSESACCPCRCNPHPHDHPGGEGGTHRTGECGLQ